ncbi:MAG TPA: antibiotic biosynthesis monooxygenase [Polyangia bacterium]|nr:antibiotic biosynthesis monooxygenase [Polyangia bacterium]
MYVEIVLLKAKSGDAERLREGLRAGRAVIASAAGSRGSVFYQGVESPESFLLHIEWDTLEAHTVGFRQGPLFPQWRSHFQAFLESPPNMSHYQPIAGP